MIIIDKNKCPQDHQCPAIACCPKKAISQYDFDLPVVDQDLCIGCKKCVKFCPKGAIQEEF
ncbi:MAG: 4Fe-4S binding protein [Gammaproteobacteria bacterium]|nr:4Fe-4S binding protein [Gammaproteobacteria bacterium]